MRNMGVPKFGRLLSKLPRPKFHETGSDWETYDALDPTKKYQYRDVYKGQQLDRLEDELPETMTSRLIMIAVLSVVVMLIVWYVIGFAQFGGAAFKGSVAASSGSGPGTSVTDTADGAEQGSVPEADSESMEPKSMAEFRRMQGMDFETYLASYYSMVSEENSALHWYLSSITGDTYDWSEIYRMWEEITKDNYAAYLAMYNGSSDTSWKDGSADNYVHDGPSEPGGQSGGTADSGKVGDLSLGGVTLKSCLRRVTFWKVFFTLLAGLMTWAIMYPIMKRNLETQNQGKDYRELLKKYVNDQHIQMPEEVQRTYDYFPDVGAHSPVQVSSMISHVMLLNKGVRTVRVARRADKDIYGQDGELMYHKGEILLDDDGEPIMGECPMFDRKFGSALFDSAKVLDHKKARVFYNPAKIPYNPGDEDRDKLKGADTVSEMINKYWSLPEYEPQRPAGAYLVDTAPVNTMV